VVDAYLAKLKAPKLTQKQIVAAVKQVVFKLNTLNTQCGGRLIETDQREDLVS
jgi:hypothetical protein